MFELDYRIVHNKYDEYVGQHGFFQIKCNDCVYGEMYPKEIEEVMDQVSLYDWFERLAKVLKGLITEDYVALSDVESYNTWIVFEKRNDDILISLVKAKKEQGSHDIEFCLKKPEAGEWTNQVINFEQFKQEVIQKGKEYINKILSVNKDNKIVDKIKQIYDAEQMMQEQEFPVEN